MKALIVVDIQKDFCEGGNLAVAGGNKVAGLVSELMLRKEGAWPLYPVVALTRDWHIAPGNHFAYYEEPNYMTSWPVHCVAGTRGAEIHPDIARALRNLPPSKVTMDFFNKGEYTAAYSGFEGRNSLEVPLHIWLKAYGVTEVDIVGLALDYCVKETAIAAALSGFNPRVLTSYTASVHPENDVDTLGTLATQGVSLSEWGLD